MHVLDYSKSSITGPARSWWSAGAIVVVGAVVGWLIANQIYALVIRDLTRGVHVQTETVEESFDRWVGFLSIGALSGALVASAAVVAQRLIAQRSIQAWIGLFFLVFALGACLGRFYARTTSPLAACLSSR